MSEFEAAVGDQIHRLRVLWPVLNTRQEHTQEIEHAINRNAKRLTADDVTHGFSDAIEACPTTGWPPGPHEILGCVMARAHSRRAGSWPRRTSRDFGMTFHEWWATIPVSERPKHAAIHKMMTGKEITASDANAAPGERSTPSGAGGTVPKPVPATPLPDEDEIEWEDAEWEEAA